TPPPAGDGTATTTVLPGAAILDKTATGNGPAPPAGGFGAGDGGGVVCGGGNCTASCSDWKPKNSPHIFGELYAMPRPPETAAARVGSAGGSSAGTGRLTSGVGGVGTCAGQGVG